MGVTIAGDPITIGPVPATAVLVSYRRAWSDSWETNLEDLRLKSLVVETGSAGRGEAILWRDYGITREAADRTADRTERSPLNLEGYWIKVEFITDSGTTIEFVGRISPTQTKVGGTSVLNETNQNIPTGRQEWTARGPRHFLEKIEVDESWCLADQPNEANPLVTTVYERKVGRFFDLNALGNNALLVGNRSAELKSNGGEFDETYIFGDRELWNHADFVRYALKRFATIAGGPTWNLTGSGVAILESLKHPVRFPDAISIGDILSKLIRPDSGLDYVILPNQDASGFDVVVFALYDEDVTIPGATDEDPDTILRKNPDVVEFKTGEITGIRINIATTVDHRYNRVKVIGAPIKITRTLWGPWYASEDSKPSNGGETWEERASLVQGWSSEIHDSGDTSATGDDLVDVAFATQATSVPGIILLPDPAYPATVDDSIGTVVSVDLDGFTWRGGRIDGGVSNMTWEAGAQEQAYLQGRPGAKLGDAKAHDAVRSSPILSEVYSTFVAPYDLPQDIPLLDGNGRITVDFFQKINTNRAYQNSYRRTLRKTQLRAGYDYSADPPVLRALATVEADFLPAAVYLFVPDEFQTETPGDEYSPDGSYSLADELGFDVGVLSEDLGVKISGKPSHALALNHWDTKSATATSPKYDWEFILATVSYEADARIALEWGVGAAEIEDGSVKVIRVPSAELWYLAKQTVVGINPATGALITSGANYRVLRYDIPDMALRLAGAIARYWDERKRATVVEQGLRSRTSLIGSIFRAVDNGGILEEVHTPITTVTYDNTPGHPTTTVSTGFAQ